MEIYIYHLLAFVLGIILDLTFGDPYGFPHVIRWIGAYIAFIEKNIRKEKDSDRRTLVKGLLLVLMVCSTTVILTMSVLVLGYHIKPVVGLIIESLLSWQILAMKSLKKESMKVYAALSTGDIEASRYAVSMIVGRDTDCLDWEGVTKAAVETVAENTSDGVIAPMLYLAIGGPILGLLYKAINTMDSMVGYKNDKYMYFGRVAARLDDVVNFVPSRLSAWLLILTCGIIGNDFDMKGALYIFKRDRFNHSSPNSAQTESVVAGALGIRLAGDAYYFGKLVKKPYIGDSKRSIEIEDIRRVNKLMYGAALLFAFVCVLIMILINVC